MLSIFNLSGGTAQSGRSQCSIQAAPLLNFAGRADFAERRTQEATVAEIEEPATLAEKEKRTIPRQEAPQEEQPEPEIGPIETPVASELQPSTGQAPAKNSAPEQTPPQPSKELQPGDKVYVAGFGWVEYEDPNLCEDGTDIYENGNKIGIMG